MRGVPAEGTWRKLARSRAPGQLVFDDLRRCSGVEWKRGPVERFPGLSGSFTLWRSSCPWRGSRAGTAMERITLVPQQFRQGHTRFAPAWAAATTRQRPEILQEITAPVSFCPAPTGKRRISCLYAALDCQIKWVVFLTGIGTIIECKPLMPS